jgi:hypothetical protein
VLYASSCRAPATDAATPAALARRVPPEAPAPEADAGPPARQEKRPVLLPAASRRRPLLPVAEPRRVPEGVTCCRGVVSVEEVGGVSELLVDWSAGTEM